MPDPSEYVDDFGVPHYQLEAAVNIAARNVYSGQILPDGPPGSYYSDGRRAAISARSIAEFADYSQLPADHQLYEPENTGAGTGRTPRESERIRLYTSARGSVFHRHQELPAKAELSIGQLVREELSSPPPCDNWRDVHKTLADYNGAPLVDPPDSSIKTGREALVKAMVLEVTEARDIFRNEWGEIENWTVGREKPFLSDVDGYLFGGCVDRFSIVLDESSRYAGVFSTELKFTDRIRPKHYLQAASYRYAFEPVSTVVRPLDAALVRIDIEEGTCEIETSRDSDWPDDAWNKFKAAYDRYFDKYPLSDTWLQLSANTIK
ncbi:hypothetical protein QA600_15060 [Natronococcus sp. A-GB1]|uniref:hypothetical protein n=1 Tax=Natronococcus sp. A-GB1 TaxID=3037648 RepID=UPI00241E1285|nr:hypothetical protein [Natronococcus sp. A-GB1]MDG5760654.1 hypothetical protein [Natronococcus sp. A-GB1]